MGFVLTLFEFASRMGDRSVCSARGGCRTRDQSFLAIRY